MQHSFWQDFLVRRELFNQLNLLDLVVMGETQEYMYIRLVQRSNARQLLINSLHRCQRVYLVRVNQVQETTISVDEPVSNSLDIRCEGDVNKS